MIRALFAIDEPASRSSRFHWTAVAVWTAVIFLAIPLARPIQLAVTRSIGRLTFTIVVLTIVCLAGAAAVRSTWRVRPQGRVVRLATLGAVGAAYTYLSISLRSSPEEALHFVQYGVLAVLVFRAMSIRIRDVSVYAGALAVAVLVGGLDEVVQWLTPDRWFGFKDIGLNTLGASLALLGVGLGLQPAHIRVHAEVANVQTALRLWMATFAALLVFTVNTPWAIEQYTAVLTPLQFLRTNPSAMADYGARHQLADLTFWSRFDLDELRRIDAERGDALGAQLADLRTGEDFAVFVAEHRRGNDAFAFETARHMISRNRLLEAAESAAATAREQREVYGAALLENVVLERYMPVTLGASGQRLDTEEIAGAPTNGEPLGESRVSSHVLSAGFHQYLPWLLLVGILGLALADRVLARKARRADASADNAEMAASAAQP